MMTTIRTRLARLHLDQRGLTTVEYAIVLCLIAAVVVGTWQKFRAGLKNRIASSTTQIDSKMDDAIQDFH